MNWSTTTLPRSEDRASVRPCWSVRVKPGAARDGSEDSAMRLTSPVGTSDGMPETRGCWAAAARCSCRETSTTGMATAAPTRTVSAVASKIIHRSPRLPGAALTAEQPPHPCAARRRPRGRPPRAEHSPGPPARPAARAGPAGQPGSGSMASTGVTGGQQDERGEVAGPGRGPEAISLVNATSVAEVTAIGTSCSAPSWSASRRSLRWPSGVNAGARSRSHQGAGLVRGKRRADRAVVDELHQRAAAHPMALAQHQCLGQRLGEHGRTRLVHSLTTLASSAAPTTWVPRPMRPSKRHGHAPRPPGAPTRRRSGRRTGPPTDYR